jgi:ATP-binding cassette subfamily B multidrug efflux pump
MTMGPMSVMRGGGARPAQKSKDLRGTLHRLLARLRPERTKLVLALFLGVTSVGFMVSGPEILGNATNVLFDGIIGKQLKPGTTKAQALELLRSHGHGQIASMVAGMKITPGIGVNINELGLVLGLAALVYLFGAAFSYFQGFTMAGLTQRVIFGLRRDVEAKLSRLPLRYFDSHPHGDVLSRVTNDIDNLTTTIQQGLSQLITSVLTIAGVMGMMFWISPLLAAVCIVTIPLALVVTLFIAKRSQVQFAAQWSQTGTLNGLVEETHTGHELVQVFGRSEATIDEFGRQNKRLSSSPTSITS